MIYDYEYFKKEIYSLTTIDLNAYKEKQMKRRIDTLIAKHKIVGYDKYVQALKTDKVLFEEFVGYITINVSEFYRNPEQWKYLEETVIPELIQRFGKNLKVWSAACSTGDEPYSLVMALSRHIPLQQIRIYATDLDKQVIAKAKPPRRSWKLTKKRYAANRARRIFQRKPQHSHLTQRTTQTPKPCWPISIRCHMTPLPTVRRSL